jgi:hypothetical protein
MDSGRYLRRPFGGLNAIKSTPRLAALSPGYIPAHPAGAKGGQFPMLYGHIHGARLLL